MPLPQMNWESPPQNFHKGATIGNIGNIIVAAAKRLGRKYNTVIKRSLRLALASDTLHLSIDIMSFNELSDREIWSLNQTLAYAVDDVADWLDRLDENEFPFTVVEKSERRYIEYEAPGDPEYPPDDYEW